MRLRPLLLTGLLLIPMSASAMQSGDWSFVGGNVEGKWEVNSWDPPQPMGEGLRINTSKDGYMLRDMSDAGQPVDNVSFTVIADRPTEAMFLWRVDGLIHRAPMAFRGDGREETVHVNPAGYPGWDRNADGIGLALPANANILLENVTVRAWNPHEKFVEGLKSFWTFDEELPYSINFLWGPLIVTNPYARDVLYDSLPPLGFSAVWLFYGAIALAGAFAVVWYKTGTGRERWRNTDLSKSVVLAIGAIGACWVLFDVRMSLEYWSYVSTDIRTFVSREPGERTFRNYENVYDVITQSTRHFGDEKGYVLLTSIPSINGLLRYYGYPYQAYAPDKAPEGTRFWLVFRDSRAAVDAQNRLTIAGTAVTEPGKTIETFADGSFLFDARP